MAAVVSVDSLTDDLFSLEEPWRSRFLTLVASRATWRSEVAQQPTPEEVAAWFTANPALCRWTSVLLRTWERPRRVGGGLERPFSGQYGWNGAQQDPKIQP